MTPELQDLIYKVRWMPKGDAKIERLEQVVALADSLGDLDAGFDARDDLSEAANAWGRPEKELVAFAWCLAQYDRDPERFAEWDHRLMWTYKRVLGTLTCFPSVPLTRIRAAFEDFRARLQRGGHSLSTHDEFALRSALQTGDQAAVEAAHAAFRTHTRAADLDCRACQLQVEVRYQVFIGDDEAAVNAAAKLFKRGAPSCNRVPHNTHAFVLMPLLRFGRLQEAAEHHRDYRRIANDESALAVIGRHLEYLGYVNDLPNGLKLLEKHLGWAYKTNDLEDRYGFLLGALPLLTRLTRAGAGLNLRLPAEVPGAQESGTYDPAQLEATIRTELVGIAALFDARNENDFYTRRIQVDEMLLASINAPFALPEPEGHKHKPKKKSPRA